MRWIYVRLGRQGREETVAMVIAANVRIIMIVIIVLITTAPVDIIATIIIVIAAPIVRVESKL